MSDLPAVSVIMPAYNSGRHIDEAIRSVLDQSFENFELLVIDDGSTDDTAERVLAFADPRVRLIRNAENLGIAGAVNKALPLAAGRYLAHCDSDDMSLPERFAKQVAYLEEHPGIGVLGAGVQAFGDEYGDGENYQPMTSDAAVKVHLLAGTGFILNPTAMYRASLVREQGLRRDGMLRGCDDYGFWADCMTAGARFANLDELLVRYRVHATNTTKMLGERMAADVQRVRVRIVRAFFPDLSGRTIDQLGLLWRGWWPTELGCLVELVRAVAAALDSPQAPLGQDEPWVRIVIVDELRRALGCFREAGVLTDRDAECLALVFPKLREPLTGAA